MSTKAPLFLDPGHGGRDPSAVATDGKTTEASQNLALALTLKQLIINGGYIPGLTRTSSGDLAQDISGSTWKNTDLYRRTEKANSAGARYFVSIHHDANNAKSGWGVYYNDSPKAIELANKVAAGLGSVSNGIEAWVRSHTTSRFGRLYIADFAGPAILIEFGPTRPYDSVNRQKLVQAVLPVLLEAIKGA